MISQFITAATVVTFLSSLALAQENQPKFSIPSITVAGTASISLKPDIATLSLGVTDERPIAADAAAQVAKLSTTVVAHLKTMGIDPADIKTENLTLAPKLETERDQKTSAVTKRTITGYEASHILRVRIRDITRTGAIVSGVVANGANNYRRIDFELSDRDAQADKIRAKAVSDAKRKAALYASGANMKLGRLLAIDVDADRIDGQADLTTPREAKIIAIPVEPGLVRIDAMIKATWELVPE